MRTVLDDGCSNIDRQRDRQTETQCATCDAGYKASATWSAAIQEQSKQLGGQTRPVSTAAAGSLATCRYCTCCESLLLTDFD